MQLSTGKRVFIGSLLIISVFLVATAGIALQIRSLREAADEMQVLSDAIRSSLMLASSIREQYVHQAHLIITHDPLHARHVASAQHQSDVWTERMKSLLPRPEEARMLAEVTSNLAAFNRVFSGEIVPRVARGETAEVLELHEQCENLATLATGGIDRIAGRFSQRIDLARQRVDELGRRAVAVAVGSAAIALLIAIAVAGTVARSIARPVRQLIQGTRDIAAGVRVTRWPVERADEFGELAVAFESMVDRLDERQRQLTESEKLATLGRLSAAVAHELNNPLGVILGYLKTMLKPFPPAHPMHADLRILEDEANQCRRIVSDLLSLARPSEVDVREMSLSEVLSGTVGRLARSEALAHVTVEQDVEDGLTILGDPDKLKQVIKNLISNAVEAMPGGGLLRVEAQLARERPPGLPAHVPRDTELIRVAFVDSGPGIPPDKVRQIFDPFFTTKTDGTGLGLFICYHIVKAHQGHVEVRSGGGVGTRVTLHLPALGRGAAA